MVLLSVIMAVPLKATARLMGQGQLSGSVSKVNSQGQLNWNEKWLCLLCFNKRTLSEGSVGWRICYIFNSFKWWPFSIWMVHIYIECVRALEIQFTSTASTATIMEYNNTLHVCWLGFCSICCHTSLKIRTKVSVQARVLYTEWEVCVCVCDCVYGVATKVLGRNETVSSALYKGEKYHAWLKVALWYNSSMLSRLSGYFFWEGHEIYLQQQNLDICASLVDSYTHI